MNTPLKVLRNATTNPVEAIIFAIAVCFFIFGVYLLIPAFAVSSTGASAVAFGNNYLAKTVVAFGFYILPAIPILLGSFVPYFNTVQWKTRATMYMCMGAVFIAILRVAAIGFIPLVWLFALTLGLISGICHLYLKGGNK